MPCADTSHAQGSEPGSHAATAGRSVTAAELPSGAVQAGQLQKPSADSDARAESASPSANAEHKGEHDLMVATGYTGTPGRLVLLRCVCCLVTVEQHV